MRSGFRDDHTPLSDLDPDALVVGLDEVALGPLAGPIITCATVFRAGDDPIPGVTDSKQLSEARRESLRETILDNCIDWGFGEASIDEIAELGQGRAHALAMVRAVENIEVEFDHLYVDGDKHIRELRPADFVVKGDARLWVIGAASILAKQEQVDWMAEAHKKWPAYGFDQHHGYGTKAHLRRLEQLGPCPIHRKSIGRVKASAKSSEEYKAARARRRRRARTR